MQLHHLHTLQLRHVWSSLELAMRPYTSMPWPQRLGGFKRVAAQLGLKYRNATCHIHPAAMHSADQDPEGSEQAPDSANEQPPSAGPDAQPVPGAPFFWRSGELAAASEDAILTLRSWREEELQPLGLHSKQKRPLELVSAGSRSGEA